LKNQAVFIEESTKYCCLYKILTTIPRPLLSKLSYKLSPKVVGNCGDMMIKRFLKDTGGNFAMMFGVVTSLILVSAGAAVDVNGMRTERSAYQRYADAAVLAAAGSGETDNAKLLKIAQDSIDANNLSGKKVSIALDLTKKGFIQVDVTGKYDTVMMGLFGQSVTNIAATAGAPLATDQVLDIALVLDITGSMQGTKIDSLKLAANALVDKLGDFENGDVRVSVIPFRDYVNIGLSRRGEPWLDVDDDSSTPLAEKCYMTKDKISGPTNCVDTITPQKTCYNDGVAYECGGKTKTTCEYTYGPEYEKCYIPVSNKTWRGCVGSRNAPWNARAHKGAVKIPGLMNINCGQEILALTDDMDVVRTKIDSLTANGLTYLPAGLVWGWRAIHSDQPLTEASSVAKKDKTSVLIFMTDGANTRSQNGAYHNGSNTANADDITKELCIGINSDGVDIYTVAYDFDAANTLIMLEKCASKKDMFYKADDSTALIAAFEKIGEDLFKLRLSH
jgi:Flp pilus assembly protein TadG